MIRRPCVRVAVEDGIRGVWSVSGGEAGSGSNNARWSSTYTVVGGLSEGGGDTLDMSVCFCRLPCADTAGSLLLTMAVSECE